MSTTNGHKPMEIVTQASCCEPRRRTAGRPGRPASSEVDDALSRSLGGRLRLADARAIRAALNGSFEVARVNGTRRVQARLRPAVAGPHSSAPIVGDLGVLSLNARTCVPSALEQLALLARDADCCESDPRRASLDVARGLLHDLSSALGPDEDPNAPRIGALFTALLGGDLDGQRGEPMLDPDEVEGVMGRMREALRLSRKHAGSTAGDKRVTAYWAAVDQVERLWRSWMARRDSAGESFFAEQSPLLLEHFAAGAAANDTLESLVEQLRPSELHLVQVAFGDNGNARTKPMTASAWIEWLRVVLTQQAPDNVRDNGAYGALALNESICTLRDLADRAKLDWGGGARCLDDAAIKGTQCALKETHRQLASAADIIAKVSIPSVCCVEDSPNGHAAAARPRNTRKPKRKQQRKPPKTKVKPAKPAQPRKRTAKRAGAPARTAAARRAQRNRGQTLALAP